MAAHMSTGHEVGTDVSSFLSWAKVPSGPPVTHGPFCSGKPIHLRTSLGTSSPTNCGASRQRQESKCLLLVKVKVRTEMCESTWAPDCEATSFWWIATRGNQSRSLRRTTSYLVSKRIATNLLRCYLIKYTRRDWVDVKCLQVNCLVAHLWVSPCLIVNNNNKKKTVLRHSQATQAVYPYCGWFLFYSCISAISRKWGVTQKVSQFQEVSQKQNRVSPPSTVNSIICLTLNIPYIPHYHLQVDMYVFDYLSIVYLPDVWKVIGELKKKSV